MKIITGVLGFGSGMLSGLGKAAGAVKLLMGSLAANGVVQAAGKVLGVASPLLIALSLMAIFFLLRIFFMLIKAYVTIILLIVLAPIILATGAVAPWGMRSWFMNLLANILIFPVVGLILAIGGVIIDGIMAGSEPVWNAPLLGGDRAMLAGIFALGMLLLIPETEGLVKGALNVKGVQFGPGGVAKEIQGGFTDTLKRLRTPAEESTTGTGRPSSGPARGTRTRI